MAELLTVDETTARILDSLTMLPAEEITIAQALGRILAQEIVAAEDIPPFANSSMDGYAVRAADVADAAPDRPIRLVVVMDIPAGRMPEHALEPHQAARIMTGAPLPGGADAVIPVEHTDDQWVSDGRAALPGGVSVLRSAKPLANVRPAGEDLHAGQLVLSAGTELRPQEIGVLVSLGHSQVRVVRRPRVAILSTGDELVDVGQPLSPGKIRNSNGYVLEGLVTTHGGIPIRLPVTRDSMEDVRHSFQEALAYQPDMLVSTAGVSVGTHDVVRAVIDELGRVELWRVNLRPGKPLAFGWVQGIPFFGLPGNPVSAMVTFDIFVRPALLKQGGRNLDDVPMGVAVVGEPLRSDGRRSYLRVTLAEEDGEIVARTTGTQSSGALLSMVRADGLLIIPEGVRDVPVGTRLPVRLLRSLHY